MAWHVDKSPELRHGAMHLMPYGEEHVATTVRWLQQNDIRRLFGLTTAVTESSHRAWLAEQADLYLWAMYSGDADYIGNTSLRVNARHRQGVFEIYIGNSASRRKGAGGSALQAVLAFAFTRIDLHRVSLYTLPGNPAAESLYKRAGFRQEGILRDCLYKDGAFLSQKAWSILAPEWVPVSP